MRWYWIGVVGLLLAVGLVLAGCGADSEIGSSPSGSIAVTQAGPQDIGEYRAIVDSGGVPELDVLDEVGFFAEHKIDLPEANCGASVCVHPSLAIAPRFDGGNWAMAFIGMNTAVDPATLPTRPRHLVLVVEPDRRSGAGIVQYLNAITAILADTLAPDDRVTVITSADELDVLVLAQPVNELGVLALPPDRTREGSILYGALGLALQVLKSSDAPANHSERVLVLTHGDVHGAIEDRAHFQALASEFAAREAAISVFGIAGSEDYNAEVMQVLTETTSGNYYFTTSQTDLDQALQVESQTGFVPLARNMRLTVEAAEGYEIGRVFGASRAESDGRRATLHSRVLLVGARSESTDTNTGRRGGGGGWFVQLLSDAPDVGIPQDEADAFTLSVEYEDAVSGELVTTSSVLTTPLGVGQNPSPEAPYFSDPERGKPFMMVNMYLALSTATMLANENQCGAARAIEPMMRDAWDTFSELFPDPDIDADFELLQSLTKNIAGSCAEPIAQVVEVPFGCGYL